jgi:hypothetical protein
MPAAPTQSLNAVATGVASTDGGRVRREASSGAPFTRKRPGE